MKNASWFLFVLLWLFLVPALPAGVRVAAQTPGQTDSLEPTQVQSEADYTFGQTMNFTLRSKSEQPVTSVTLFFTTPHLDNTYVVAREITASRSLSLTHELSLSQVQLAPFTTVTYWWRLDSPRGSYTLPMQTLTYEDDRFSWQELAGPHAVVYWTGDDLVVGQAALDVVARAWPRLEAIIPRPAGTPLPPPQIYIYPSTADLRSALSLTGRHWVGAEARPELGVVLVTAVNPRTAVLDLGQTIPHELVHLMLYQATGPGYENVPRWFEEGLATLLEATPSPDQEQRVRQALATGTTLPFATLCAAFPADTESAGLAYAQSTSLVRHLQAEYGTEALTSLIRVYADGADCESGVRRVFNLSLAQLEAEWLEAVRPLSSFEFLWQQAGLWLVLLGGGFAIAALLLLPSRRMR